MSAHGVDKVLSNVECLNAEQTFEYACLEKASRRTVDIHALRVGNYKVCFRKAAICSYFTCWDEWDGTGLQIDVQDLVTGFNVNGAGGKLNTAQGQMVTIPWRQWHTLTYFGSSTAGGMLKMLRSDDDCSDYTAYSTAGPLAINRIDAAFPNVEMVGRDVDNFFNMSDGTYQVCFLQRGNLTYLSTGVSVTIQKYVDGLEVNGIMPNHGLRVWLPRSKSSRLRFFRRGREMEIGDQISLIPLESQCFDSSSNVGTKDTHRSGHMRVTALPLIGNPSYKVLSGLDAVATMGSGAHGVSNIYKVIVHESKY